MFRLLVFCFFGVLAAKEDYRYVTLEGLGEVKGLKFWDGDYHEFYGVPYATAPTGRDRYKVSLFLLSVSVNSLLEVLSISNSGSLRRCK